MTSAPASARPMATAWPMPRVQPVIMAVWPSREKMLIVTETVIAVFAVKNQEIKHELDIKGEMPIESKYRLREINTVGWKGNNCFNSRWQLKMAG